MTVQEVVEQVVDQIEGLRHTLHNCDEGGCGYVVQARELIADALMTFARARERAVWEEAARELIKENDYQDDNGWAQAERHWSKQFCLRATQAEGKEAE